MATSFKSLSTTDDVSTSKTLLNENIPLTGSILSGTYSENNIFNYTHGMFQTVYDYPYASSSANNLMDITVGYSRVSPITASIQANALGTKKINIYNQMAKVLVGADSTGSIFRFDEDGLTDTATDKVNSMYFLSFSRLLVKDEIKKGSFTMEVGLSGTTRATIFDVVGTISDASGTTQTRRNSPVGEYGILYLTTVSGAFPSTDKKVGLVFYQAGVVALSTNLFAASSSNSSATNAASNTRGQLATGSIMFNLTSSYTNIAQLLSSGTIKEAADSLRTRIKNINFQNTTELNSAIYTLRINNSEFNYSSNPTYLTASQIRIKNGVGTNAPISYITTAGLYSDNNELLAVAKLSEPLKKTPDQSLLLRVRLDY